MIVKLMLATTALIGSVAAVAPIALGASSAGSDPCGTPPTTSTPTTLVRSAVPNLVPSGAGTSRATPAGCQVPAGAGGSLLGADQAVARAMRLVGSHGYYQLCARLAANIWGRPRAGYFSAAEQWRQMVATGNAHPDDRNPPSGALVFWETGGPYGHVAVYLGEGRIVSNDINDDVPGEGGVYLVDVRLIESKWGATYLGWAPPIYSTT